MISRISLSFSLLCAPWRWGRARILRGLARTVLNGAPVGLGQTLFAAGGDSLHAVELAEAMRRRFGVEPPLGWFATHSLWQLAGRMGRPRRLVAEAAPESFEPV